MAETFLECNHKHVGADESGWNANLPGGLLYYLAGHMGQNVTTEELNQHVWGYTGEVDNTMLKNVVYRLRRKIEADPTNPKLIQTVASGGYKLAGE